MTKMNPDIKIKWIEALRSGKFKQGKGRFYQKNSDTYCCLGVLCVIQNAPFENYCGRNYPSEQWVAGLSYHIDFSDLSRMNDSGKTFSEIANYIEKEY